LLLVGLFAAVALTLGLVGVYGLIAWTIAARRREIGIRLAVGASPIQVLGWALRSAGALIVAGAAAGTIGGVLFNRLLRGMIYGVSPTDPMTFAAAVALLTVCALAAALRPAILASRTDPLLSLQGP
jgi:ABC-type antimicrobial peptide transport system permease subunit